MCQGSRAKEGSANADEDTPRCNKSPIPRRTAEWHMHRITNLVYSTALCKRSFPADL